MELVVYAMRFLGEAKRVGVDGSVLKIRADAPEFLFAPGIEAHEPTGHVRLSPGKVTSMSSEKAFTGTSTFQETGTVVFGTNDDHIRFSTVGSGFVGTILGGSYRHGAAIWQVDGGEGKFEGATGLIVSNFLVSREGEITDHQLGVMVIR